MGAIASPTVFCCLRLAGVPTPWVHSAPHGVFYVERSEGLWCYLAIRYTTLPGWMQAVALLSPATCVLAGKREALLEHAKMTSLRRYIWPLLAAAAIAIPVGTKLIVPG